MEILAINGERTLLVSGDIDDWDEVWRHRVDTIVDMDGGIDPGLPEGPSAPLYVYFPIADEELPNLRKLDALGLLVAQLVRSEHVVLVHCRLGYNRSNLVAATALTYLGMSGPQALAHLRSLRPGCLFNQVFARHVESLPARVLRIETT